MTRNRNWYAEAPGKWTSTLHLCCALPYYNAIVKQKRPWSYCLSHQSSGERGLPSSHPDFLSMMVFGPFLLWFISGLNENGPPTGSLTGDFKTTQYWFCLVWLLITLMWADNGKKKSKWSKKKRKIFTSKRKGAPRNLSEPRRVLKEMRRLEKYLA